MRIILINLPWQANGRLGVRAGSRWPFTTAPEADGRIHYVPFPFFLAYAAALLKREGKAAMLTDAIAEGMSMSGVLERLSTFEPALIIAETSTPSFISDMFHLRRIKTEFPHCRIALCGPHAGVFPGEILMEYACVDYILIGEYEYTALELINRLEKNVDLSGVDGLAYRDGERARINKPRQNITDIDDLPWPEREDVPIYHYNDGFAGLAVPNVQMWASRGCPYGCNFCLWPQTIYRERRYRRRRPENVVEEMEFLINKWRFQAVYFDDDVFNIDREYVKDICREIERRKITVPWAAMARADLMDEELLRIMADAGMCAVKYGIESGAQSILDRCGKNMRLAPLAEIIALTGDCGIKTHLTFCLGLPGENKETLRQTVDFIKKTRPDSYQIAYAVPFPGTALFEQAKHQGRLKESGWSEYDGAFCRVMKSDLPDNGEMARICDDFRNNFDLQ